MASFIFLNPLIISARTSSEIEQEIANQQNNLNNVQTDLANAQQELENSKNGLESAEDGLPSIEAEIKKIENEINVNKLQLEVYTENKKLKELEKSDKELSQNLTIKNSYIQWRATNVQLNMFIGDSSDYSKMEVYSSTLTGNDQNKLEDISTDLSDINTEINEYKEKLTNLDKLTKELQTKKEELEAQAAYFRSRVNATSNSVNTLISTADNINRSINTLRAEQQTASQRENWILTQQPQTPTNPPTTTPVVDGFKFMSQGRDIYQGHGVGMSQWGAHGMGQRGYNAAGILTFYYSGTQVVGGYEGLSLNVDGYGAMNIERYVAGQGEVPGRACGNQQQASAQPNKYVVDNPNTIWDCWPEETIKAQIIAFRTYALKTIRTRGSICTSAACQVYNGTTYTQWAADETRGQVVTYGGDIIQALYSADNNQGNGTANNDTIFQNIYGDGTAEGYLRAVNDSSIATNTSWTYWQSRTNTYNYASIIEMLNYIASTPSASYAASTRGEVQGIINSIGGQVASLTFERDSSQRVKKVWFNGVNGQSRSLGGWWFKNMWNTWAYDRGSYDYIYSQTFFFE